MLWAEMRSGTAVPLQTVRLPLSDTVMKELRDKARLTLQGCGFSKAEIASTQFRLDPLLSAKETRALLDPLVARGDKLVLVDFPAWEAMRIRLGLKPQPSDVGGEPEMSYRGLKIRCSAAS